MKLLDSAWSFGKMKEFFAFPFRIRFLSYNNFPQKSHHRKAKYFILFTFRVLLILLLNEVVSI